MNVRSVVARLLGARLIVVGLCLLSSLVLPSVVFAAPDINMGLLNQYLPPGQQGAWKIHPEAGSVVLENSGGSGDITYYYVNSEPAIEGRREISVEVGLLRSGAGSMAGLLYGYQENPKSYYIFALNGSNTINLYQRSASGFELRMSQQLGERLNNQARLAIREQGNTISLLVNGREVSSFGNDSIGRGGVGIAAVDVGVYRFSDFQVNSSENRRSNTGAKNSGDSWSAESPAQEPQRNSPQSLPAVRQGTPIANANTGRPTRSEPRFQVIEEVDPKLNMVSMRMTIPANWKKPADPNREVRSLKVRFEAPDGTAVYQNQTRYSVIPSGDPMLDQLARDSSVLLEPYEPLPQLVKRLMDPQVKKYSARFIKAYKIDALLNFHRQELLDNPWYTRHFESYATEWDMGNGSVLASLVIQAISKPTRRSLNNSASGKAMSSNTVVFRTIEAPVSVFEKSRDQLISSVANIEVNAVWKNRSYQNHVTKMAQIESDGRAYAAASAQAHSARMSSARERQTQIGKTYSDILDISHSGYMSRSTIKYSGHQSSIRGINERTIISNGNQGGNFSVQAGSKHYWVNEGSGQYLGTDNPLFDPRTNNQLPGQWELFQQRR